MQKAIRDNKVVFVCENLEEAFAIVQALYAGTIYTSCNGKLFELAHLKNVSLTIVAEFEQVGEVNVDAR